MRLVDLKPHWINLPQAATGVRFYIGVSFLCPTDEHSLCPTCGAMRGRRLAFNFWPPIDPDNAAASMSGEYPHAGFHQRVSGETFDTLTIAPSIGLDPIWHGTIKNGEILPDPIPQKTGEPTVAFAKEMVQYLRDNPESKYQLMPMILGDPDKWATRA